MSETLPIHRGIQIGMFMLEYTGSALCGPRTPPFTTTKPIGTSVNPQDQFHIPYRLEKAGCHGKTHTDHSTYQPRTPKQAGMRTTAPRLAQHSLLNGRYIHSIQHNLTEFNLKIIACRLSR